MAPPLPCPECSHPFRDKRGVSAHFRYKHPGVPLPWKDTSSDATRAEVHEERMAATEAVINKELAESVGTTEAPKAEGGGPEGAPLPHNPFNLQKETVAQRRVRQWQMSRDRK